MTFAVEPESGTRLTGTRVSFHDAPLAVQQWAEQTLGSTIVEVHPRSGGMSPAVATTLVGADGRRLFLKAVGPAINPDTPSHFRHEIAVLTALPPAPYRAALLSTYDDGDWVGIALDDVQGQHPDWSSPAQRQLVFDVIRAQTAELTPAPPGVPPDSSRRALVKYVDAMRQATPQEEAALPVWAAAELPALIRLSARSLAHHRDESFCHWDVRHDNILIRERDGQPLLLDWGMSRHGQHWADTLVFALEWVDTADFDALVASIGLDDEESDDVTGFLAAIGCYLTMVAIQPPPPSLPNIQRFRRQLGLACLAGVRRRLSA